MLTRLLPVLLLGCTHEITGEHLTVVGGTFAGSAARRAELLELGEDLHERIVALHPPETDFDPEVRVELHGRFRNTSPYVDVDGTVHLWRFSEREGGYRAMFAHELVHAVAYDANRASGATTYDGIGFWIEGWAEYTALQVDPEKTGFPLFGFDEDVVVGHWLEQGGPTLADYRERHEELNMLCQGQAYPLRASWYRYVAEELGQDVLFGLVAMEDGVSRPAMEAVLGQTLEQVDADWESWARARYAAHPDAAAEAEAFRAQLGWYTPCE